MISPQWSQTTVGRARPRTVRMVNGIVVTSRFRSISFPVSVSVPTPKKGGNRNTKPPIRFRNSNGQQWTETEKPAFSLYRSLRFGSIQTGTESPSDAPSECSNDFPVPEQQNRKGEPLKPVPERFQ